MVEFIVIFNAF